MSCERWDDEIALWAGGDAVSAEFREHHRRCLRCRREGEAMREAMREWSDWRIPEAAPRRRPLWPWAVPAIAAGLAALVWFPKPAPVETLAIAPPAPPAFAGVLAFTPPPPRPPAAPPPIAVRFERAATIKILTDDPSVVILLVGDSEE